MNKDEALKLLEKATRSCNNTEEQRALDVLIKEALAQPEQNFCPRCGKRTPDLTTIHTCTPPRGLEMT